MKYYDISVPFHTGMHHWPTDVPPEVTPVQGAASHSTNIKINSHNGTHVDAPFHMLKDGAKLDEIPLDWFLGEAQVIEIADPGQITADEISKKIIQGMPRVLFKTKNSSRLSGPVFFTDYVYLTPEGAGLLAAQRAVLVGIDYLSIDEFGNKAHLPHKTLMSAGIVILEGLDLSHVPAGRYELICLPLNIPFADGAPARAVLKSV